MKNINCRESGIELLKLIAMGFIVIFHVTQTLSSTHNLDIEEQAFINLSFATANIKQLILVIFRSFGIIGNAIFFISSAWFLCYSKKSSSKKIIKMAITVWQISILILIAFLWSGESITDQEIKKCCFPTFYGNNWYITCYLLFCLVYPYLNRLLEHISQKELLFATLTLLLLYSVLPLVKSGAFYFTDFIFFIEIYFIVAYMKKYMLDFANDKAYNIVVLIISVLGLIGGVLFVNLIDLGFNLNISFLRYYRNGNIFSIFIGISLFNIFRNIHFTNSVINKLSGLTLLIYIIHENILIRTYLRPKVFVYIYRTFGYSHIVLWVLLFSLVLFIASILLSLAYKMVLSKTAEVFSNKIYSKGARFLDRITLRLSKIT